MLVRWFFEHQLIVISNCYFDSALSDLGLDIRKVRTSVRTISHIYQLNVMELSMLLRLVGLIFVVVLFTPQQ